MPRLPSFTAGAPFVIDGEPYVFSGGSLAETGGEIAYDLQFQHRRTNSPLLLPQADFDDLFSQARIQSLTLAERPMCAPPEQHDLEKEEAEEAWGDTSAVRRRFYCEAFDARAGSVSLSDKSLTLFIQQVGDTSRFKHKRPSPGALRVWLRLSQPGDRRLRFLTDGRRRPGRRARRVSPTVLRIIADKFEQYAGGVHVNLQTVCDAVRGELVSLNKERGLRGLDPITVSQSTIRRYVRQDLDLRSATQRFGVRFASSVFKPLQGSLTAPRPLDIAVMDHTRADIGVIDDEHMIFIGRPWITALIDVCTRSLLGIWISFEPPSVFTAMACLRHAVRPKVADAKRYPDVEGEWIAFGPPIEIVVDNAWEFTGSSFREACADNRMSVRWAPVGAPEFKGIVERFWRTLNDMLLHRLPGGLPFTPQQRSELGIDPELTAAITLSDLRRVIYQWNVEVYGRHYHKGIEAAPERLWRDRILRNGQEYVSDLAALDASMTKLASPRTTLGRDGVRIFGMTYSSPEPMAELLAAYGEQMIKRDRRVGRVAVKVKYHPENLGSIEVWNNRSGRYVTVPCTMKRWSEGISEHHAARVRDYAKANHVAFHSEEDRLRAADRMQAVIRNMLPASKVHDRERMQRLQRGRPNVTESEVVVLDASVGVAVQTITGRSDASRPPRSRSRQGNGTTKARLPQPAREDAEEVPAPRPPAPGVLDDVDLDALYDAGGRESA